MFATFENWMINLMIPKCVLSISNNEYCITLLKLIAQYEANLQILAVSDGKQGIAYAQLERPDLILLDIAMPRINGLDGLDVHRLLKCNLLTCTIPIILVKPASLSLEKLELQLTEDVEIITNPFID